MGAGRMMRFVAAVSLLFSAGRLTASGQSLPLEPGLGLEKLMEGMEYLKKYAYIHLDAGKDGNGLDMDMIKSGIRKFQVFHGLPVTETIDTASLAQMQVPRCGCGDPVFGSAPDRDQFRYGLEGGKWNKTELTVRISRIPSGLSKKLIRRTLKEACRVWSGRSPLKFTEVRSGRADINVRFMGTMNHGDRRPFWQPMQEVGHGFPPSDPALPGDIHLDASENYTFGEDTEGINLFQILVHMIGHTIGLGHSPDPQSVMHPTVRPRDPDFGLTGNDMTGLHALYGPAMPSTQLKLASTCTNVDGTPFDEIAVIMGEIHLFKGQKFWRLQSPGKMLSGPEGEDVHAMWHSAPNGGVDAVYQRTQDWRVVIIKGSKLWLYGGWRGNLLIPGYPKPLFSLGLPNNLDAAVHTGRKTLFVKGKLAYQFDEETGRVDEGFPKLLSALWRKIPKRVDSAFHYEGDTYFIVGDEYYQVNSNSQRVKKGFPRSFREDFLSCQ